MSRRPRRAGYVLLLTIVMIAIVALLLAGIARQSLHLALAGLEAQQDLQRRWGATSCQQAILARAEEIFERQFDSSAEANNTGLTPASQIHAQLVLGGMNFELMLADEDAKLNLNTIYHGQGEDDLRRMIQQSTASGDCPEVRLRPYRAGSARSQSPAVDSWGQVFALDRTDRDGPTAQRVEAATAEMTCWGRGRMNVFRAPDERIERLCQSVVQSEAIGRLLELRKQYYIDQQERRRETVPVSKPVVAGGRPSGVVQPTVERRQEKASAEVALASMLDQLHLRAAEREKLKRLLTHQSRCHSLWVTITTKERSWSHFTVLDSSGDQAMVAARMAW